VPSLWPRLLISAIAVVVLLTFVPIGPVWNAIRGVNPWVWGASVGVFASGQVVAAVKLWVLLGPGAVSLGACLRAHFAGISANLALPGVVGGDVVRASLLLKGSEASRVAVAATADRVVDALVMMILAGTAAAIAGLPFEAPGMVWSGWFWPVGVVAVAAVGLGTGLLRRTPVRSRLVEGWSEIPPRPAALALAAMLSLVVQAAFILANVWLAREVGLHLTLAPWVLAWTASKLSALPPVSVGGLGVREAALASVLVAYGAPAEGALATALLWDGTLVTGRLGGLLATQALPR
jgi:uncharacterized membrane protein YbhN (UPF0104 family)